MQPSAGWIQRAMIHPLAPMHRLQAHIPGETIDLTRQPIQAKRTALLVFRLTH